MRPGAGASPTTEGPGLSTAAGPPTAPASGEDLENVREIVFGRLLITLLHIPTSVHEKENTSFTEQVMDSQKHMVAA